ncbi:MAG: glycosylhydrolase-like jelly roll fold domain-containing protein [Cyclobacteriaceae bacterium]
MYFIVPNVFPGQEAFTSYWDWQEGPANLKIIADRAFCEGMNRVVIHGQSLGISWTKPHHFDITGVVKQGANELKVEVANTWSNRLTGDGITGEKFTQTNIAKANKFVTEWKDLPLKKSGLIGPVTITVVKVFE